jgi:hypothetical protein
LETKPNFSLTGKYFSLTNFFNDKQIQKNLKNNFFFQKINIAQENPQKKNLFLVWWVLGQQVSKN